MESMENVDGLFQSRVHQLFFISKTTADVH